MSLRKLVRDGMIKVMMVSASENLFFRAGEELRNIQMAVKRGEMGTTAVMEEKVARAVFRLSGEVWALLKERGHEIGICPVDSQVEVRIEENKTQRRKSYEFLYGLPQAVAMDMGEDYIAEPPASLLEIEWFKELFEQIRRGNSLGELDKEILHLHAGTRWRFLGAKQAEAYHPCHMFEYE